MKGVNMKSVYFLVLIAVLLASCSSAPSGNAVQTAIAQTIAAYSPTPTNTLVPTLPPSPTDTPNPTRTSIPTLTPLPAPTQTETPSQVTQLDKIAKNYVVSQDSGGVLVEVVRFLIGEKSSIPQDFSDYPFDDKPVLGEIVFRVTNNTNGIIKIYPEEGTVVVNKEQVDLNDYITTGTFGDDVNGEIYPGVISTGGIWFGLKDITVSDASHVIVGIDAPYDSNGNKLGSDYYMEFDLSGWVFEPIPDEYK
jgi:hypothetical protein